MQEITKEEIVTTVSPRGYLRRKNASAYYDALVNLPERGRMLEIGTGRGHSTSFFAQVKPRWIIYTVDQWRVAAPDFDGGVGLDLLGKLVQQWRAKGLLNIVPIVGNSLDIPWELAVDALYIDGDHCYDAVKSDFERFTPWLREDGVVMMDDYGITGKKGIDVREYVDGLVGWEVMPVEGDRGVVLRRR